MDYLTAAHFSIVYDYSLWANALVISCLLILALEFGYRVGLHRRRQVRDADIGGGSIVSTSLFALLGLILAFTYSSAVQRHEQRKQSVVAEANALGTAYLRADILAEPARSDLKQAIYRYALTRAPDDWRQPGESWDELRYRNIAESIEAQRHIWPIARKAIDAEERLPIASSLLSAINELLDSHIVRISALVDTLPAMVLGMLQAITMASLAVAGFMAGIHGRLSRWRLLLFALVLAGMIIVILDYDRPHSGLISINEISLQATIADMQSDLEANGLERNPEFRGRGNE